MTVWLVDGPGSVVAVSAAPAVLAGVYLLVVSRPTDVGVAWIPPARSAAALATGAVVVIVALVVGSNWPLATARTPVNLRSHLDPPVDLGQAANPLDLVPRLEGETSTVAFTAHVDTTWINNPTDWRLVSLDVYDGTGWTTDARAVRAGNVLQLPAGEDASQLGPSTSQTVTVKDLDGPWVPTTGVPTRVTPSDLAYDPSSSVLVGGGDLDGRTFHLTSRIPSATKDELDSAGITVSDANTLLTQVPACTPPELAQMARTATAEESRPDQEAVAIEQTLATRSGFADDPAATPGSSCGRLQQFLTARQGTDEQFATAFVLMARSVGLPSRLAVGFTPGAVNAAAGTTTVMGSDATVWPEVDFAHLGWEPFDPIPSNTTAGPGGSAPSTTTTTTPAQKGISQVRNTVAANSSGSTSPTGQHGTAPTAGPAHQGSGAWAPGYLIPIGLVVLGAAIVVVQVGRRRRRRARRRDPARPPAERIRGAWAEVLDALAPFEPAVASLTPSEVAVAAATAAGAAGEPVQALGVLVDGATYGPSATADEAATAWALSDRAGHALREAVPLGLRLRHVVTGGPRRERISPPAPPLAPPGDGGGGDVPPIVERPSVPV